MKVEALHRYRPPKVRVARWYIFEPKIPILVGLRMEMLVYLFNGYLKYFTVIWYILWPFGNVVVVRYIFPPFW
jgi:hypothetical protein